jgi:hypothetical protein
MQGAEQRGRAVVSHACGARGRPASIGHPVAARGPSARDRSGECGRSAASSRTCRGCRRSASVPPLTRPTRRSKGDRCWQVSHAYLPQVGCQILIFLRLRARDRCPRRPEPTDRAGGGVERGWILERAGGWLRSSALGAARLERQSGHRRDALRSAAGPSRFSGPAAFHRQAASGGAPRRRQGRRPRPLSGTSSLNGSLRPSRSLHGYEKGA